MFLDESASLCSFEIDLNKIKIVKEFSKSGIVNGVFEKNGTEVKMLCRD